MCSTPLVPSLESEVAPVTASFYRSALQLLTDAQVPFLVGGAFSHACFTGIRRSTKDLDLFIRRQDYERIAVLARDRGWHAQMSYPHWLAKIHDEHGEDFIDLIFNSGNGVTPVGDDWFESNRMAEVLGVNVRIANVEDSFTSKAFIMERERYDGADIAHLLHAAADHMDWPRLVQRFGANWRVLMAHLTLFGFIYPGERHRIPRWVMETLLGRLSAELREPHAMENANVCAGTLLSREQYLHDVEQLGYIDGRLTTASTMTADDVAMWTQAIPGRMPQPGGADSQRH